MNIVITGATGFIGGALVRAFASSDRYTTGAISRAGDTPCLPNVRHISIGDLATQRGLSDWLRGAEVVIHTAARAHVMVDTAGDPLSEYRHVNVIGTYNLARHAAVAGVRRFIFISSIKVNGDHTDANRYFTPDDVPAPGDAYGISKWEAEQMLGQVGRETGMEIVIIRPPLVYGPGVKGNFANLIKVVERGFPLPLGAIRNRRSLISLDNLIDLIRTCVDHPAAANRIFLAGDGEDLSTTDLLRRIAAAMDKRLYLIPVSADILRFSSKFVGRADLANRLLCSLRVDISMTRRDLGWNPPFSVNEGLRKCFN